VFAKLESLKDGQWRSHTYSDSYAREQTTGPERLVIGCSGGHAALVGALAAELRPPYKILYVLHTPRGGSDPARYESPPLDGPDVEALLREFGVFWSEDARHDVWLHSGSDAATVVWDRHDIIYAYGPLVKFERVLGANGIQRGTPALPPSPHAHHYHAEWDQAERALVGRGWLMTPLRSGDEQ
jgi:hypothetical protein